MQIFNEINENNNIPNKGLSLAFGFFDGVHIGHQAVIKSAVDFAKENNTKSAIITFQDHPCCYFYHVKPQYIVPKADKIKMFEQLGVDYLYMLKFDEYFAMMDASKYLQDVIVKNFAPVSISTGFNHSFGAHKSGDVKYLCTMQKDFCYRYFEVAPVLYNSEIVSSTRIREDLGLGNIEMVNLMLEYDYYLEGVVVEGQKLGRQLGFKTANINYPDDLVEIGKGVYQVEFEVQGETYQGVGNYGLRPTVAKFEKPVLEVHILDFDKDIYSEKVKVTFKKKIRDEKRFDSLDELKSQIKADIDFISA